jgi:hypothetical protein
VERNTKKDCIIKYLKTQFSDDTADVQRYYVMNTIKKSASTCSRDSTTALRQ